MSHLVSPCFANFPGGGAVVWCLLVGVFGFLFVFCFGLLVSGFQGNFCI